MTFDMDLYRSNRQAIIHRLEQDNRWNSDGLSLICLDHETPGRSFAIRSLHLEVVRRNLIAFSEETVSGRVFVHQRAATTFDTSLDSTHGWSDGNGIHLMHNGIIASAAAHLTVDSQELMGHLEDGARGLLDFLRRRKEAYANCFVVDTTRHAYGVVRLEGGTLFTDGDGNYSTVSFGPVNQRVKHYSAIDYSSQISIRPRWNSVVVEPEPEEVLESAEKFGGWTASGSFTSPKVTGPKRRTQEEWKERAELLREMKRLGLMADYHVDMDNDELAELIQEQLDLLSELEEVTGTVTEKGDYRKTLLEEIERQGKESLVTRDMTVDELEDIVSAPLHRVR